MVFEEESIVLQESDRKWVSDVIVKITAQMDVVSERSQYKIPYTTVNGTHDHRPDTKPGSDLPLVGDHRLYVEHSLALLGFGRNWGSTVQTYRHASRGYSNVRVSSGRWLRPSYRRV